MPFTSFSGHYRWQEGAAVRFAPEETCLFSHSRGLWTNWTSVRKAKQGEIPADIFALLTCEPNAEVGRRKQRR